MKSSVFAVSIAAKLVEDESRKFDAISIVLSNGMVQPTTIVLYYFLARNTISSFTHETETVFISLVPSFVHVCSFVACLLLVIYKPTDMNNKKVNNIYSDLYLRRPSWKRYCIRVGTFQIQELYNYTLLLNTTWYGA